MRMGYLSWQWMSTNHVTPLTLHITYYFTQYYACIQYEIHFSNVTERLSGFWVERVTRLNLRVKLLFYLLNDCFRCTQQHVDVLTCIDCTVYRCGIVIQRVESSPCGVDVHKVEGGLGKTGKVDIGWHEEEVKMPELSGSPLWMNVPALIGLTVYSVVGCCVRQASWIVISCVALMPTINDQFSWICRQRVSPACISFVFIVV